MCRMDDLRGRLSGLVVSYSDDRGFGFVRAEDDEDYFFRFNDITVAGYRSVAVGARVTFTPVTESSTGRRQANDVRLVSA